MIYTPKSCAIVIPHDHQKPVAINVNVIYTFHNIQMSHGQTNMCLCTGI